jgi:hypothetical protein
MPFAGGKIDPSEAGKKGAEKRWGASEGASEVVAEGPVDVLAEMEALLSRPKGEDRTDFQKKLRGQYEKDFDGYMDRLVRLRGRPAGKPAEGGACPKCAARKREEEEDDQGGADVMGLLRARLERINVEIHIGEAVGERWFGLPIEKRRAILELAGVPHTFQINPGMPDTPTLSVLTEYGEVDGARRQADQGDREEDH